MSDEKPPMEFPPDRHARTPQLKAEWEKRIRRWYPDAIEVLVEDYGYRVVLPHPDTTVANFSIVWRYNGISERLGEQRALVDWLRDMGESLRTMEFVRYKHGSVSTLKQ